MSGTSTTSFTASAIVPNQDTWGHYQRFTFPATDPLVKLQAFSEFVPTSNNNSIITLDSRNFNYAGFRWHHLTKSTDVNYFGSFTFQSYIADGPGTDIYGFDGTNFNIYAAMNMNTQQINNLAMAGSPAGTDAVNVNYLNTKISASTIVLTGNVTGSGVVGTPFATTIASTLDQIPIAAGAVNLNSQNIINIGNIGIGVSSPSYGITMANVVGQCKICLFANSTNAFQIYGFGITAGILSYSVAASTSSHVFYAGTTSTTNTEIFRIAGTGILTAHNSLNMNTNQINNVAMAGSPAGTDAVNVTYLNSQIAGGTIVLTGNVTGSGVVGTSFATTIASTLDAIPHATAAVNLNSQNIINVADIGIGVSSPTFPIQFSNTFGSGINKINLYQVSANAFQGFGFGINTSTLSYFVDSSSSNHVFYCGASSTTATEVFRIAGAGYSSVAVGSGTFYSRVPCAQIYMQPNTTATSCTAGNFSKIAGVTTSGGYPVQFTTSTSNRITFNGTDISQPCVGMTSASVSFYTSSATAHQVGIGIFKNGIGGTQLLAEMYCTTNTAASSTSPNHISITPTQVSLSPTDYLELFVTSSATENVTVSTMNLAFQAC